MINFTETVLGTVVNDKVSTQSTVFTTYAEAAMVMGEVHTMTYAMYSESDADGLYQESFLRNISNFISRVIETIFYPFEKISDYINISYKRRGYRRAARPNVVTPLVFEDGVKLLPSKYALDTLIINSLSDMVQRTIDKSNLRETDKEAAEIIEVLNGVVSAYKEKFKKLTHVFESDNTKDMDIDTLKLMNDLHVENIRRKYKELGFVFNTIAATYTREASFRYQVSKLKMLPNGKPVVQYDTRFKKPANKVISDIKDIFKIMTKINDEGKAATPDKNRIEELAFKFYKIFNSIVFTERNLSFQEACDMSPNELSDILANGPVQHIETDIDAISTYVDITTKDGYWEESAVEYDRAESVQIARKAGLMEFTEFADVAPKKLEGFNYALSGGMGKMITLCLQELSNVIAETNLSIMYYTMIIVTVSDCMNIEVLGNMLDGKSPYLFKDITTK